MYIKELPEDAKQIKNALCWIDRNGNLYGQETRIITNRWNYQKAQKSKHKHFGEYFKYNTFTNKQNGYVYGSIKYIIDLNNLIFDIKQRRIHIIVTETFIENPSHLPVVGHKNNIKSDNRVENLYWTTYSENTQKAVDDGLLVNDKGYDDSQSHPVYMYNTYTNELLGAYGSVKEAARETEVGANTILRQCKYKKPVRKPFYFRFQDDKSGDKPIIVVQYDLKSDEEIGRYWNSWEAERQTGISSKNILQQCHNNRKPSWTKSGTYFLYM